MKVHNLKIKYCFAEPVALGIKTFELREDDRNYQVGDYIAFDVTCIPERAEVDDNAWNNISTTLDIIGKSLYKIIYKLKGVPEYGLDEDYCILSLKQKLLIPIKKPSGNTTEETKWLL